MSIIKAKLREIILIAVIIVIGVIATCANKNFFTVNNISNIFNVASTIGIMSVGMTLIIATGNIDVSIGGQFFALCMISGNLCASFKGENGALIFLVSIAAGTVLGLINGVLIAKLRIPAIVVTLAMLSIIRGTVLLITDGGMVAGLAGRFIELSSMKVGPVYITPIIWVAVSLLAYVLLYRMRVGREILAVGGNAAAAERIGISSEKINIIVFMISGMLVGLSAPLYTSKVGTIQSVVGTGYEMKLIAAVVIGGTAFSGGVASLLGTFCGMMLLGVIDNMLVMLRVSAFWQEMTVGAILLIAVTSSAFNRTGRVKELSEKQVAAAGSRE